MITIPPLGTSASKGILAELTSDVRLPGTKIKIRFILALVFLPPGEPGLNPRKPVFETDYCIFSLENKGWKPEVLRTCLSLSLLNIYSQPPTKYLSVKMFGKRK